MVIDDSKHSLFNQKKFQRKRVLLRIQRTLQSVKQWRETAQEISNQLCRWEKQIFIEQEVMLLMLETNIQNQYGKEL